MAATCAYVKEGQPKWQVTDGRAATGYPHPDYPTGSCFYLRYQDTTNPPCEEDRAMRCGKRRGGAGGAGRAL